MDKKLQETIQEISNRLPLVTINGYDKVQTVLFGFQCKSLLKLKVLPNGEKIKDKLKYLVDTPTSIRRTHHANLKKLSKDEDWRPCQEYIDKVIAESKLLDESNHELKLTENDKNT